MASKTCPLASCNIFHLRKSNKNLLFRRTQFQRLSTVDALDGENFVKPPRSTVDVHTSLPLSPIEYSRGWAWQQVLLLRRKNLSCREDVDYDRDNIILLEHKPVYTLGRGADENHLTFLKDEENKEERKRLSRSSRGLGSSSLIMDKNLHEQIKSLSIKNVVDRLSSIANPVISPNGAPIYRIERGGEVTYHGPGQLVVYPMFDLKQHPFRKDLHWYLRTVEELVIEILRVYDIEGVRDAINTGVWFERKKVAAVGVSSSGWITTHGFALNVSPDLKFFDTAYIFPCGIEGRGVTSIHEILKNRGETNLPTVADIARTTLGKIETVFGVITSSPKLIT
mmetsp:Transcript_16762/g.25506  ORF Transcript_16762/g.25506 Transcript_16762/m.25506 type:complete len:338 (+) Transcript_16762:3-1016(+)